MRGQEGTSSAPGPTGSQRPWPRSAASRALGSFASASHGRRRGPVRSLCLIALSCPLSEASTCLGHGGEVQGEHLPNEQMIKE